MLGKFSLKSLSFFAAFALVSLSFQVKAQSATEEKFQELFITAGYSTAFGAAIGAALLAFKENPGDNLRYIAIGASVGFITGSILGGYLALNPSIGSATPEGDLYAIPVYSPSKFTIVPVLTEGSGIEHNQWNLIAIAVSRKLVDF